MLQVCIDYLKYCFNKTVAKNIIKQKDKDAFDLQNMKRVGQSFYISVYFIQ